MSGFIVDQVVRSVEALGVSAQSGGFKGLIDFILGSVIEIGGAVIYAGVILSVTHVIDAEVIGIPDFLGGIAGGTSHEIRIIAMGAVIVQVRGGILGAGKRPIRTAHLGPSFFIDAVPFLDFHIELGFSVTLGHGDLFGRWNNYLRVWIKTDHLVRSEKQVVGWDDIIVKITSLERDLSINTSFSMLSLILNGT